MRRNGALDARLGGGMTTIDLSSKPVQESKRDRGRLKQALAFAFPLTTNMWPLLLFASQKVFVLPSLLLVGFGDRTYHRDIVISLFASLCGLLIFLTQTANGYEQPHFLGFLLFVWSIPPINYAVRMDAIALRRYLTYLTLFNVAMGFFLLLSNIDLYGLRGLNRVVGTDGEAQRVYFESSSLAAVVLTTTFKRRWLQIATILAVLCFMIFVARSVAIIFLIALNFSLPHLLKSTPLMKLILFMFCVAFIYILYIYIPIIRPDIELSLRAKQFQFDVILGSLDGWSGWGWGSYLPPLSSDPEQPYQIEMQLPMLLLQIGPLALLAIFAATWLHFLNCSNRYYLAIIRLAVFMGIGFNNPWLFIPSWFLTCQLLFRYEKADS